MYTQYATLYALIFGNNQKGLPTDYGYRKFTK